MELQGTLSRDRSEEDSKARGKMLWTLIKDFCDYTSAHGFGRIKASKNWLLTIFWSMLFIGAVTIMTIQLHSLYKKYKSRPLTTLIEVETSTVSSRVSFPANIVLNIYTLNIYTKLLQFNFFCFVFCTKFVHRVFHFQLLLSVTSTQSGTNLFEKTEE